MPHEEDRLQAKCFQWSWNDCPETRYCIWHVPNGMKRTIVEAVMLKAMGVLRGVHDLHFYWKGQYYIFELKVGDNVLSASQIRYRDKMISHGAKFFEIRTFERFKAILLNILANAK